MKPERWQSIRRICEDALDYESQERESFLARACAGDDQLRKDVDSFLSGAVGKDGFIETPAIELAAKELAEDERYRRDTTLSGQTFLHYHIAEKIGAGGMGDVYRAHDDRLKRDVAIKVLPEEFASDGDRVTRFQREARLLASLNHPHICTIYDIDEHAGRHFIAMELIEGQTLRQRMLEQQLEADEILIVALEVTNGLEAAHAKGIIHRDIKPANIFVTAAGHAKILDFGLAKLVQEERLLGGAGEGVSVLPTLTHAGQSTGSGIAIGTVAYMSPEQALGKELDARTDLFSLGVVLYEMATRSLPFRGDTPVAQSDSLLHHVPISPRRLNPEVPDDLEQIINKALEKDCQVRYQSAGDLLVDLKRLKLKRDSGHHVIEVPGVGPRPRLPSLAVLAFTNMSVDQENEYFCDGLSEELINALSHIQDLRVAARTSAFAFKGKEIDIREIGKKLNVGTVLEGSVRKSGQRLRITAQLINVEDGCHIWSGQFDRGMKDVFDIQEEISLTIVDHLKLKLMKGEREKILKRPTEDHEAYNCYLKGRYFWYRRYEKGMQRGLQYFQQAIEIDPDYAMPHVGIADTFGLFGLFGFLPPRQAFSRAKAAAKKALEIDPELAEAYASLGWIAVWYDWDWPAAESHFLKAIQMKPEYALAHHWRGVYLSSMGQFDESIREMQKACELEPLEPVNPAHLGMALYMARRFDESMEAVRKVMESDPDFWLAYWYCSGNLLAKKMWGEAIATLRKLVELTQGSALALSTLGFAYGLGGMKDEAFKILERLEGLSKDRYVGSFWGALVWMGLGERNMVLENMEKAHLEREPFLACLKTWPLLDCFRSEPGFQTLLKKMNLDK
jgi:serine/threonine protein kinase/Flp pilus assembly protein TadD